MGRTVVICGFGVSSGLGRLSLHDRSYERNLFAGKSAIVPVDFNKELRDILEEKRQDVAKLVEGLVGPRQLSRILERVAASYKPTDLKVNAAAPYSGFSVAVLEERLKERMEKLPSPAPRYMDPVVQYGLDATLSAVEMAGVQFRGRNRRWGSISGSGLAGGLSWYEGILDYREFGRDRRLATTILSTMNQAPGAYAAMVLGLGGPGFGVTSACASSGHTLLIATQLIASGQADAMLAIGSEECISRRSFENACFDVIRAMSRLGISHPMGIDRDGFLMASGASALWLADFDTAIREGWPIYGYILGGAMNADANNMVAPSFSGIYECFTGALNNCHMDPNEVDIVNCHATSTPRGDVVETQVLLRTFFDDPSDAQATERLNVTCTKGLNAHLLGAAGTTETINLMLCLLRGEVNPLSEISYELDPKCERPEQPDDTNFPDWNRRGVSLPIRQQLTPANLKNGINSNFGFGGLNCVLGVRLAESARWERAS